MGTFVNLRNPVTIPVTDLTDANNSNNDFTFSTLLIINKSLLTNDAIR